jgi:hypothetical protein
MKKDVVSMIRKYTATPLASYFLVLFPVSDFFTTATSRHHSTLIILHI